MSPLTVSKMQCVILTETGSGESGGFLDRTSADADVLPGPTL